MASTARSIIQIVALSSSVGLFAPNFASDHDFDMSPACSKSPESLWLVPIHELLREQSVDVNIRVPVRLLHARSSPSNTADFCGALVEDVADSNSNIDTTRSHAS
jgi:hypothetical protein